MSNQNEPLLAFMSKVGLEGPDQTYNPGSTRVLMDLVNTGGQFYLILLKKWYDNHQTEEFIKKYNLDENYWLWDLYKTNDKDFSKLIKCLINK